MSDLPDFHSFNKETGVLEDIDEVRAVAVRLAVLAETWMSHPLISTFMPHGAAIDTATYIVSLDSLIRPLSQAEFYRTFAKMMGEDAWSIEKNIRDSNLSEVYSLSSPNATQVDMPDLDPNHPLVKSSTVLSFIAEEQARKPKQPPEPPVKLTPGMEKFLGTISENLHERVLGEDGWEEHAQRGGDDDSGENKGDSQAS